jgi:hyaluronan synthase
MSDASLARPADASVGHFIAERPADGWDWLIKTAIVFAVGALVWMSLTASALAPLTQAAERHGWLAVLVKPSLVWLTMGAVLLVMRTLLWFRYTPFAAASASDAPAMTVVIPAYNEGPMVAKAIDSVASANYPPDRLQIIVVDDGSTDDTWVHMQHAAARHGGRVKTLRLATNSGKREALAAGFQIATGDVVVTVDSDSVVAPEALLALAGPFANPRVGVVAGRVLVYNRREGLIPRMLHVRFLLAFDFLRAYQSGFGTVYCSPGALSAYRMSAVRRVLDGWLNQRFLGARATYGEDRALTNDIMRLGYDSVYQRAASVLTVVPTTYARLCKMFLRWERSYVREELRFARIVWTRRPMQRLCALFDMTITNLRYPALYLSLLLLGMAVIDDPMALVRMAAAMLGMAAIYSLYCLRSERSTDVIYGVLFAPFAFLFLSWIPAYAVATVRAQGWLTR